MKFIIDSLNAAGITRPENLSWVRFKRFWFYLTHKQRRIQCLYIKGFSKQLRDNIKKAEQLCPHVQGCLGVYGSTYTSIVWHYFPDKVWRGVCTACLRQFHPEDSDYEYWKNKVSGNLASTSLPPDDSFPFFRIGASKHGYPQSEYDYLTDEELLEKIKTETERYKLERSNARQ